MKCLNCQRKGKHFEKKICPPCVDSGVTRDQIKVTRQKMTFIGSECGKDAQEFLQEMLAKGKNISHIREKFVSHAYDPSKNEMRLSWSEYETASPGDANEKPNAD